LDYLREHLLDGELGDIQEALEVRRDERPELLGRVADVPAANSAAPGLSTLLLLENLQTLIQSRITSDAQILVGENGDS
jgi:hypothetical protein